MGSGGNSEESSEPNAGSSEQVDDNNPQVLVQGSTGNEDSNEGTVAHSVPKKRGKGRPPKVLPPSEVPQHIRDKIKVLLNLKYFEGGCALVSLAIEYEDYYGEELNPRNYGFEDMKSMLNAFPKEELIMKKVGTPREPRVFAGVPLKKTDRIVALKKIFEPAGQPNIPWRKDEQVIPPIDESCWNDGFLQSILEGANTSSLIDDSNQSLSISNPVEVSSAPAKTKDISSTSISLQTETESEPSSGLPDSTKESNQVTLELADADTSNAPSMEQPGTSRSSGVPQPATESEPEVSIIVENPKPEEIVECITIEDSDEEEESTDSTSVKSKLPSVQPVILPKTEARPIAQVSNRWQILADFVETLQKKGQSKTANNLTNKCNNPVSAASSNDTSTVEKSTSSQVNTRSRQTLSSNPVHVSVENDLETHSVVSTRTHKSRATNPKKDKASKVQKSPEGTPSLALVVEEGPLDLTKEPVDPRKELVDRSKEPVDLRKERLDRNQGPHDLRKEPVGPTKESVDPRKEPVRATKEPVGPTKEPVGPTKEPVRATKEPVGPTKEPVGPTKEPVGATKVLVGLKKVPEALTKSGPTVVIQTQPPSPEPNPPLSQLPPLKTAEGYKCRITEEELTRCMSMFVLLKRLEDCKNPTTTPRKSSPRKRKISEISIISSDDDLTNKFNTRRKSPRLLASKKPSTPTVSDLCEVPSRPDQYWFTTSFREDIDGIAASTYVDLMQYTEILCLPEEVETEDNFKKFTKPSLYYFLYTDQLKSILKRLAEAAKEWNDEMYQGYYLNAFATISVDYTVSATETEITLNDVNPEQSIKIPMMNYEAIQMANLDADANICDIAGRSEQMVVVTSYGNYADYFLWKWGKNCQCVGLLPANSDGFAKFKRAGGVSYDNFYLHDDGASNVFDPEKLDKFIETLGNLYPSLADLFVANGIGWTGMQQRSKDLTLAQCLLALEIVRQRGSFILKLNDTFTDLTAGLIFYLSRCFGYVTMMKPVSSLPGERFVICRDKRSEAKCKLVKDYLRTCYNKIVENQWVDPNLYLDKIFGSKDGIPTSSSLTEVDNKFLFCLKKWNSGIVKVELDEYDSFCIIRKFWDDSTPETRGSLKKNLIDVRSYYLEDWNLTLNQPCLPPEIVAGPVNSGPTISSLLDNLNLVGETTVETVDLNSIAGNFVDWKFVLSASSVQRYVIHATDAGTLKWDGTWTAIDKLKLPNGTFLYGEIFPASKSRPPFLSVIDVKQWGTEILDDKPYNERIRLCQERVKEMEKNDFVVTFSVAFNVEDLPTILNKLNQNNKFNKSYFKEFDDSSVSTTKNANTGLNICVGGLLFVPIMKVKVDCMGTAGISSFSDLVAQRLLWSLSNPLNLGDAAETLYTVIRNRGPSSSNHVQNTQRSNFAQFVLELKNLN